MVRIVFSTNFNIPINNIERVACCNNCLFIIYANDSNDMWEIIVYRIKKYVIQCVVNTISSGIDTTDTICNFLVNDCRAGQGDTVYTPVCNILVKFGNIIKLFTYPGNLENNLSTTGRLIDVIFYNLHYYVLTYTSDELTIEQYNTHSLYLSTHIVPINLLPHKNCIDRWKLMIIDSKTILLIQDEKNSIVTHIANIHNTLEFVPKIVYPSKQVLSDTFDRVISNDNFLCMYNNLHSLLKVYNTNLVLLHIDSYVRDVCLWSDDTIIILNKYMSENNVIFHRFR